jgi:hypothetical protein
MSGERLISKEIWPPRSLVLLPLYHYLWRMLRGEVYKQNPHTLQELIEAIINAIQNIS